MDIGTELRIADKSWNVLVIAEVIIRILRANPELTMLDIEDGFRVIESKSTYLVARPVAQLPPGIRAVNLDGTPAKFGLWVCVNGIDDMLETLKKFRMSVSENRKALRECGFNEMEPTT